MAVMRFREEVVRRPSLPLSRRDERELDRLRGSPLERELLARLSGEPVAGAEVSEAALLHAVFGAGLASLRAAAEEEGYAQLAAETAAETGERRAAARRRQPAWAGEE